jgi:hypothetical protein
VGLAGDEDSIVLDCYWLAQWYHQSPEHFLSMPLLDVAMHVARSRQLAELRRAAARTDDDDGQ